eukprot:7061781-Prorocentrum_lima.AAC.1
MWASFGMNGLVMLRSMLLGGLGSTMIANTLEELGGLSTRRLLWGKTCGRVLVLLGVLLFLTGGGLWVWLGR